jgi:putative hydrolase of the HAD superfamily
MTTDLPRAALIDLDDTIIDDTGSMEACWLQSAEEAASRLDGIDATTLLEAIEVKRSWFWSDPERHRVGRLDLRAATRGIVQEALVSLGVEQPDLGAEIAERYRDLREERLSLFPGALDALERLRAAGVRLGMVTNGSAPSQRAKIERFGLAPYFDCILIEGEFGQGKPHAAVYQHVLAQLDSEPRDAWCVGDNLEWDVGAPQAIGVFGIWHDVRREGLPGDTPVTPDRIVHSLSELA